MVDTIVSIAIEVVKCVAKCSAPCAGRRIGYFCKYKSNFEKLEAEVEKLKNKRTSIQQQVDAAKRNVEEIEENVQKWLERAEEIEKSAQDLLERARKKVIPSDSAAAGRTREDEDEAAGNVGEDEQTAAKNRWFEGLSPGLTTRYQLGKEAVMHRQVVVTHLDAWVFDQISHPVILKDPQLSIKDYEAFESRASLLTEVISSLKDPHVNIVGIYGMGGIGKTTLAKAVANHPETNKFFDSVIFLEVTEKPDKMQIQRRIGERLLDLQLSEQESESNRATKLCERLKQEKSILIILDNIWDRLDLRAIGIPCKDEAKGCKILLTARDVDVLSSKMDSQCNFLVGFLNDAEVWNMFEKISGRDYTTDRELESVAKKVAKKCAHLPILIVTVARALSNKPLFRWKDFLQQMGMSSSKDVRDIHASIELSYKYLENEILQKTLLLIRYANLTSTDELLMYGMSMGLFDDIKEKVMEGRHARVETLVQQLKDSCLLLDGNATRHDFSMHDVVRDVVKSIADGHAFTNEQDAEFKWPDQSTLNAYHSIVLKDVKTGELPPVLECQQLKLLSISATDPDFFSVSFSSLNIHNNFFTRMTQLKVLVLANMDLSSLPESICFLSNLQALGLYNCQLDDVAILGELKNLEILSLRNSKIKRLSAEVRRLIRLKSLDLRHTYVEVIPPNVISSLSSLEELYMDKFEWEKEGLDNARENASLSELKHLAKLTCLELKICDANTLPGDLSFRTLERYKIAIGSLYDMYSFKTPNTSRKFKLSLTNTNICLNDGHIMQLKGIEDLCLIGLQHMKSVLYELDRDGFPQLKHLQVQDNDNLLCIVDLMERVTPNVFPILESLLIRNLVNLEVICRVQITAESSFSQLRKIKVEGCHKLENIFSLSIARRLQLVESIDLTYCKNMKDVFVVERGDGFNYNSEVIDNIKFCQLRSLKLNFLPQFRSIYSKLKTPSTSQQRRDEIILEDDIGVPYTLFTKKVALPNLEKLVLDGINVQMIWQYQAATMSSIPSNLIQLKYLKISNCEALEEIVVINEGDWIEFPSLKELYIQECAILKQFMVKKTSMNHSEEITLPFLDSKVALSSLEKLTLDGTDVQIIWQNQGTTLSSGFKNLTNLTLSRCDNLRYLFSYAKTNNFDRLQYLEISDCQALEDIVVTDEGDCIKFPSLRQFIIVECPKLKQFMVKNTSEDHLQEIPLPFFNEKVVLPKLVDLRLSECNSLRCLFSSFTVKSFGRLQTVEIWGCSALEVIFDMKSANYEDLCSVVTSQLRELYIHGLPKLRHVWNKDPQELVSFQNLTTIIIDGCDVLKNIFPKSIASSLSQLISLDIANCGVEEIAFVADQEGTETMAGAVDKGNCIEFPSLKRLYILKCPKLKEFMVKNTRSYELIKIPLSFFNEKVALSKLEDLSLIECNSLQCLFSFSTVTSFVELQHLKISKCSTLEVIFDLEGANSEDKCSSTLSQLRDLSIDGLPNLKHIWNRDPKKFVSFEQLESVSAIECDSLKNLFPVSIVSSLSRLEILYICECGLEEIVSVADQEEAETNTRLVFPRVKSLQLYKLPNLTMFCPAIYTIEWPKLEELGTSGWEIVMNILKSNEERLPQKVLPKLERLFVKGKGIVQIWQFPEDLICNLNYFFVELDESTVISSLDFLQRFHNMKMLKIKGYEDDPSSEVDENAMLIDISNIDVCSDLKNIWIEESNMDHLVDLQVFWCENLINLVPSSTSFRNLSSLEVWNCKKLTKIVTSSTAKSLVQLRKMEIDGCDMLTEVVAAGDEGDVEAQDYEIVFSQLKELNLSNLESLTSFCSANYTLKFPSLEEFFVISCPKIKNFCRGELSAPKLQKVKQSIWSDEWSWKGDLNKSIQELHEEEWQKNIDEDDEDVETEDERM